MLIATAFSLYDKERGLAVVVAGGEREAADRPPTQFLVLLQEGEITRVRLERGPRRDVVLLNAAAVLSLESGDWATGLAAAVESVDSGAALNTLDNWVAMTNSFQAG